MRNHHYILTKTIFFYALLFISHFIHWKLIFVFIRTHNYVSLNRFHLGRILCVPTSTSTSFTTLLHLQRFSISHDNLRRSRTRSKISWRNHHAMIYYTHTYPRKSYSSYSCWKRRLLMRTNRNRKNSCLYFTNITTPRQTSHWSQTNS